MGRVTTSLAITNRLEQGLAKQGIILATEVRSVSLKNVLVDTGITNSEINCTTYHSNVSYLRI